MTFIRTSLNLSVPKFIFKRTFTDDFPVSNTNSNHNFTKQTWSRSTCKRSINKMPEEILNICTSKNRLTGILLLTKATLSFK